MARILFLNPNANLACGDGISAAIDRFRAPGRPMIDVVSLSDGPDAIVTWRHWHAAVEPLCRAVEREAADVYVIACASDPGIEAVQASTARPVLGAFRAAVAVASGIGRFGVIALADQSIGRHALALRAMGLEGRLAGEIAMNMTIPELLDPARARGALIATAQALAGQGAEAIILGCTGMAHHRQAVASACGLAVIDPCQAACGVALARL